MMLTVSGAGLLLALSTAQGAGGAGSVDAVAADRLRIRAHLAQVEGELRARDVAHISPAARAARARALDTLHRYWSLGRFPHEEGPSSERVPIFIDAEGRPCAVAELMLQSGAAELAQAVATRENQARVLDMHTDLSSWLAENGLTAQEAAQIQPAYCQCSKRYNPVCATISVDGGTQERTFVNQCVVERCAPQALFLHDGECTGPGAALAVDSQFDRECACSDSNDTRYACDCRFPGSDKARAPLGALSVLALALALLARWKRRR
jgi:hypothetical protein